MLALDWKRCIVLALVAVSGVGLLASCGPPQPQSAVASPRAIAVKVVPATTGSISVATAYATIVEARDQVDLVPLTTGRVDKLTVDIGSDVRKGQIIAELSHGTLDAQLQQAQAKLAGVKAAAKPNELKARAQLDSARADLNQLLNPSALDLQVAQSVVATAQSNLGSAKVKLDQLRNPTAAELAAAQEAVADAHSEVSHAQAKVDQAISIETSAAGLADYDVDQNPVLLDAALANLNLLKNPTPADFAAVETAVAFAERTLALNQGLRGRHSTETGASVWGVLLIARQGLKANTATLLNSAFISALTPDEVATVQRIITTNQEIISTFMAVINSDFIIPESIRTALWVESMAIAASEKARAALQELQNPSQYNMALAENEVNKAQASLEAALAQLNLLKTPRPAELVAAKTAVAVAEQTLALNEEAYARHDIQSAQAQVNLVKQQLAELQVLAPFDGLVTQVWLAAGAVVSPQTPIVTIMSKIAVVSSLVEETGVNSLQVGQRVTFTSRALPGQYLELQISRIVPTGDNKAHTFLVQMHPIAEVPELKPGMSGEVSVLTRHEDAVLVPREAVRRQDGQSALFIIQNGNARLQNVEVGLVDDKVIEILEGIQPGDLVVVSGQNLLNEGDPVNIEEPSNR